MPEHSFTTLMRRLVEIPTAPFREQWICSRLDNILDEIPGIEKHTDSFGNRIVRLSRGTRSTTGLVFVAHLDHPGFVVPYTNGNGSVASDRLVEIQFEGRVKNEFFLGSRVRLFRDAGDSGVAATIHGIETEDPNTGYRRVRVSPEAPVREAVLGMWDTAVFQSEGDRIRARVCDDLAGCAILLAALAELSALPDSAACDISVVFTRAEEAGFCGTLCMINEDEFSPILPTDPIFISVETSGEVAVHQVGDGAIIRLGDRATTFDNQIVDMFWALARTQGIKAKRALMDRGTCEATPFSKAHFRTGGVCIPVRNYHNMNMETGRIDLEEISKSDAIELVRLIVSSVKTDLSKLVVRPDDDLEYGLFLRKGREFLVNEPAPPAPKV